MLRIILMICIFVPSVQASITWQDVAYTDLDKTEVERFKNENVSRELDMLERRHNKEHAREMQGREPIVDPIDYETSFSTLENPYPDYRQNQKITPKHIFKNLFIKNDEFNTFEIGTEFSGILYEESDSIEEKGAMFGIFASYTHRKHRSEHIKNFKDAFTSFSKPNVFRFEGKLSLGQVDFESATTGELDDNFNLMTEWRGLLGYDIPLSKEINSMLYGGLGYRFLRDDLNGTTTTSATGFLRTSGYVYFPIGIEVNLALDHEWSLMANFEIDKLLFGKQVDHLEDVAPGLETLKNSQSRGFGLRGSMRLSKHTYQANFFVEPFFRFWKIKDSETNPIIFNGGVIGVGIEPKNTSKEYGVKMGAHF